MSPTVRPSWRIRAELDELRRHLHDMPPHHGHGTRDALEARLRRLERELATTSHSGTQVPSSASGDVDRDDEDGDEVGPTGQDRGGDGGVERPG